MRWKGGVALIAAKMAPRLQSNVNQMPLKLCSNAFLPFRFFTASWSCGCVTVPLKEKTPTASFCQLFSMMDTLDVVVLFFGFIGQDAQQTKRRG